MGKRRRRFQFCIGGSQSVRRLFLQLSAIHDLRQLERRRGTLSRAGGQCARRRRSRGLVGTDEMAKQWRAPNFSPSFSKSHMFFSKLFQRKLWWFCGISTGYKGSKPKESLSKFFVSPASVRPRSERRRATFRRLGRSDPGVFSGSSCCGTAGRTFRPSLNLVSQPRNNCCIATLQANTCHPRETGHPAVGTRRSGDASREVVEGGAERQAL